MNKRILLLFLFLLPSFLVAQSETLTGTVVAFNQYPISNITVKAKKAKSEVQTDQNGRFEIQVKEIDVIRIKESGFIDYSQRVSDKDQNLRINLFVVEEKDKIELVSQKGYIAKEDLDYGFQNLYMENNVYSQFDDAYDALKYALPAATITSFNGVRGVVLRGRKSIMAPNPQALIVVNGQPTDDISFLSPTSIISIKQVDAQGKALYGARGFNGVIEIETR